MCSLALLPVLIQMLAVVVVDDALEGEGGNSD